MNEMQPGDIFMEDYVTVEGLTNENGNLQLFKACLKVKNNKNRVEIISLIPQPEKSDE